MVDEATYIGLLMRILVFVKGILRRAQGPSQHPMSSALKLAGF